jgi:dethiobiotin synthetase
MTLQMTRGLFVTGTDTGIGKTRVAVALVRTLALAGIRVAGVKPIAAGLEPHGTTNADVAALADADGLDLPACDRNPYAFKAAIAPHLAARDEHVTIDLATVAAAWRRVAVVADVIVVEGAGGALVPLGADLDMLDVPRRLRLPVLLVVGVRLGCLNHALLSAQAIRARGLTLAGWVANRIDPEMDRADDNVADLVARLPVPLIADVAWQAQPSFDRHALGKLNLIAVSSAGAAAAVRG